jgi:hypothetical protein
LSGFIGASKAAAGEACKTCEQNTQGSFRAELERRMVESGGTSGEAHVFGRREEEVQLASAV